MRNVYTTLLWACLICPGILWSCKKDEQGEQPASVDEVKMFQVTVAAKTSAHPYFGEGSALGYVVDSVEGKLLTLTRGKKYAFSVNTEGHPFYISTSPIGQGVGEYTTGVTNSKITSDTLTFIPPSNAPDTLYYQCTLHPNMGWMIVLTSSTGTTGGGDEGNGDGY